MYAYQKIRQVASVSLYTVTTVRIYLVNDITGMSEGMGGVVFTM